MGSPSSRLLLASVLALLLAACGTTPIQGVDADGGTGGGASGGGAGGGATGGGSGGASGGGSGGGTGGQAFVKVGPSGGSVDLLHFLITGDTRPPICEDTAHYPTAIINGIADQAEARGAQFALDLGDHMFECLGSLATATKQMALYTTAVTRFSGTWFMTMGNHECTGGGGTCLPSSSSANYKAYMSALSPLSTLPYYAFQVATSKGRVTFVVVADNGYDSAQATWLESTLADADLNSVATIISRHHPVGDTTAPGSSPEETIIFRHKFALFLTGHSHTYKHPADHGGRTVILGTGGAPLKSSSDFNGYAMVDQQADGTLKVDVYNLAGNTLMDSWSVGPN